MPPKTRKPSWDPYANQRCLCGHIVYVPGDPCVAAMVYDPPRCNCTDHKPKAAAAEPQLDLGITPPPKSSGSGYQL